MVTKQKVVVDTDFFQKLSKIGQNEKMLRKLMDVLGYELMVHTYIDSYELDMNEHYRQMKEEGYIWVVSYQEFLEEDDKELYEHYFHILYEELNDEKLEIRGTDLTHYHRAGKSMGEIHSVLMAIFMGVPIFLSDDSDAQFVGERAKVLFDSSKFRLEVHNIVETLIEVARQDVPGIEKKELVQLAKETGHAREKSTIRQAWNKAHGNDI